MSLARVVANMRRGPQGNMVADYRQDYIDMYGKETPHQRAKSLGTAGIPDLRDNRDPAAVGLAHLAGRNGGSRV